MLVPPDLLAWAPQDCKGSKAMLARLARKVLLAPLAPQAPKVCKEPRDLSAQRGQLATKELVDPRVLKVCKVCKVCLDQLVPRELSVP